MRLYWPYDIIFHISKFKFRAIRQYFAASETYKRKGNLLCHQEDEAVHIIAADTEAVDIEVVRIIAAVIAVSVEDLEEAPARVVLEEALIQEVLAVRPVEIPFIAVSTE